MIRLLLVQHAETAWNVERRYQGDTDIPLNERGRRQAARLGLRLARESIDTAIASDLGRAWDTASAIAKVRALSVQAEPRLRELNFGAWEGMTYARIRAAEPAALAAWEADPERVSPPGGERLTELAARVQSFLDQFQRDDGEAKQTVLLVGHRGSLGVLLCLALGLPPRALWRYRLDAASVTELKVYRQASVLVSLNDTHHLREVDHAG
jgi:broad specificity phosphatase PhoE